MLLLSLLHFLTQVVQAGLELQVPSLRSSVLEFDGVRFSLQREDEEGSDFERANQGTEKSERYER